MKSTIRSLRWPCRTVSIPPRHHPTNPPAAYSSMTYQPPTPRYRHSPPQHRVPDRWPPPSRSRERPREPRPARYSGRSRWQPASAQPSLDRVEPLTRRCLPAAIMRTPPLQDQFHSNLQTAPAGGLEWRRTRVLPLCRHISWILAGAPTSVGRGRGACPRVRTAGEPCGRRPSRHPHSDLPGSLLGR